MASFLEELKIARKMASTKYRNREQKPSTNTDDSECKTDEQSEPKNEFNEQLLLRYSRRESISDQIRCGHPVRAKCINCVSRKLLPFDRQQLSLKHGLFQYVFSECESIESLVRISRSSTPKLMNKSHPKTSLQYGEVTFYGFAQILYRIQGQLSFGDTVFIDFGSGISKTLFVAALLFWNRAHSQNTPQIT